MASGFGKIVEDVRVEHQLKGDEIAIAMGLTVPAVKSDQRLAGPWLRSSLMGLAPGGRDGR